MTSTVSSTSTSSSSNPLPGDYVWFLYFCVRTACDGCCCCVVGVARQIGVREECVSLDRQRRSVGAVLAEHARGSGGHRARSATSSVEQHSRVVKHELDAENVRGDLCFSFFVFLLILHVCTCDFLSCALLLVFFLKNKIKTVFSLCVSLCRRAPLRRATTRSFEFSDVCAFATQAATAIDQDSFTVCFESPVSQPWNW